MIRVSANLGFLWTDLPLPDAIRAAKANNFDAVECHWPYDVPEADINKALQDTGLRMLSLNTRRGDVANGQNGVAALPGHEQQAQQFIEEAIGLAVNLACDNIHVMAGNSDSQDAAAQDVFAKNLHNACVTAAKQDKTILIEPLNKYDAPGYHLATLEHALEVIEKVGAPNLKIMFDCYHQQLMGGDLLCRFKQALDHIGHVQFASVPARSDPSAGTDSQFTAGEVNYPWLLNEFVAAGYDGMFGAEYKPATTTDAGLRWMRDYKS